MLNHYSNKMLAPDAVMAVGPPPPGAPRGRCPACGAVGRLVVDPTGARPRQVVAGCRCPQPPPSAPSGDRRS